MLAELGTKRIKKPTAVPIFIDPMRTAACTACKVHAACTLAACKWIGKVTNLFNTKLLQKLQNCYKNYNTVQLTLHVGEQTYTVVRLRALRRLPPRAGPLADLPALGAGDA